MNRWTSLIVAAAAFALAGVAHAQEDWTTQATVDGRGSVDFPAKPLYNTRQTKTSRGSVYTMHQYSVENSNGAFVFVYTIYPPEVDVSDPRASLQRALQGAGEDLTGGAFSRTDWLQHQGMPAVEASGAGKGYEIRTFWVLDGHRLFAMSYVSDIGKARQDDSNRFIQSLKLNRQ